MGFCTPSKGMLAKVVAVYPEGRQLRSFRSRSRLTFPGLHSDSSKVDRAIKRVLDDGLCAFSSAYSKCTMIRRSYLEEISLAHARSSGSYQYICLPETALYDFLLLLHSERPP